ncbi:MAG: dTDP-4-amino-4,6-dideoxygalactose transaminase [Bacillota bacterium]
MKDIPFTKPYLTDIESEYVQDVLKRKKISGDRKYTKKVNKYIENKFDTPKALLTTSCTHALEMACLLIDLKPNDEVILPSYTFVSTANPILLRGAEPVFVEIKKDTLNMDPNDIEKKITDKTKAIIPVHYAGVGCNMEKIMKIAKKNDLYVIEDAAQAVNAKYKDDYLGTIGDIGCYSFHESKNYVAGEGGAILINNDNSKLKKRAEIIREKGTNRSEFMRGEVDKYTWVDIGSSYLPSDLLAALLWGQLKKIDEINNMRRDNFEKYYKKLKPLEREGKIRLPKIPKDRESNYHLFYIIFNSKHKRNEIMDILKNKGIHAVFHYVPLHSSPMGKKLGYKPDDLPITEEISSRILRLPLYPELESDELNYIIDSLYELF